MTTPVPFVGPTSKLRKSTLATKFQPKAQIDIGDLHLRLWRAASPKKELEAREQAAAGADYLAGRRPSDTPTILFDPNYYLSQLPWFVRDRIDPLDHYLSVGWSMDLAPHPAFDTAHLANVLGVRIWHEPPLLVYFEHAVEVSPHPLFDVDIYGRYVGLEGRDAARLFEVFIGSWAKASAPFSRFFSTCFYGKFELGTRFGGDNPLLHYLLNDENRRRDPNPMLHSRWYNIEYPAAPGQPADPVLRFVNCGLDEGHMPNPFAARQFKLQTPRAPCELLVEYVDVSAFEARWYEAGALYDSASGRRAAARGANIAVMQPLETDNFADSHDDAHRKRRVPKVSAEKPLMAE